MDERDNGVRSALFSDRFLGRGRLAQAIRRRTGKGEVKYFCGETRVSNKAMQKVFHNCGYELDRIEKGYYTHPGENAYKYILRL